MLLDAAAPSEGVSMANFSNFCDMVAADVTPAHFNAALMSLQHGPGLVPPGFPSSPHNYYHIWTYNPRFYSPLQGFPSSLTPAQEQSVLDLFRALDKDGNGYIDKAELIEYYGDKLAPELFAAWNLKPDSVINAFELCKFFDDHAGTITRPYHPILTPF